MKKITIGSPVKSPLNHRIVTQDMVRARTVELANIGGRMAHEIKQSDYEQAKRELTGETNHARQQAVFYPIQ